MKTPRIIAVAVLIVASSLTLHVAFKIMANKMRLAQKPNVRKLD
jgi:hypothetical protein